MGVKTSKGGMEKRAVYGRIWGYNLPLYFLTPS
jgi:hypothetical protein